MTSLLFLVLPYTLATPTDTAWLESVCDESRWESTESARPTPPDAADSREGPISIQSPMWIDSYDPRIEALREAVILLGEGHRLAQEERIVEAREKWQSAAELYEKAKDALGAAEVYQRLADSYLLKPSARGSLEQLMRRLGFQDSDLENGLSPQVLSKLLEHIDWEATFDPKVQARINGYYIKAFSLASSSYEELVRDEIDVEEEPLGIADDLYRKAVDHLNLKDCNSAELFAEEARRLYQEIDYKPGELRASGLKLQCKIRTGGRFAAFTDAQDLIRMAATLPLGNEASELTIRAKTLYETGQLQAALDFFQEARLLYEESNDLSGIAQSTLDMGVTYIALGNYSEGERLLLQSLNLIADLDPSDEYRALNLGIAHYNLGNLHSDTVRPRSATRNYCTALRYWNEMSEPALEVATLSGLGVSLRAEGRLSEALEALNSGLELQDRLSPEPEIEGDLLNNIGYVYYSKAEYTRALDYFYRSLERRSRLGSAQKKTESLNNIASTLAILGRFNDSLKELYAAFEIARDLESSAQTRIISNIGTVHQHQGNYRRAIQFHSRALRSATIDGDVAGAVSSQLNLSKLYQEIGDLPTAEEHITETLRLLEKGERTIEYAQALSILAQLQVHAGRFEEAESTLRRAEEVSIGLKQPKLTGQIVSNLAVIKALQNDFQTALTDIEKSLETMKRIDDRYLIARMSLVEALLHIRTGDSAEGIRYARQVIDLSTEMGMPAERIMGFTSLSLAHLFDGKSDLARAELKTGIELLEAHHGTMRLSEIKSGFLDQFSLVYSLAVVLEVLAEHEQEAFGYSEKARSRAFLDQLGSQWIQFLPESKGELAELKQSLRSQLIYLQKSIEKERSQGHSQASSVRLASLSREAESVRQRYWKLLKRLRVDSPEHSSIASVETLRLAEVQEEVLDDGTTLIEFFDSAGLGNESMNSWVFAWIVERDSYKFVNLDLGSAELRKEVERLRNIVESRKLDLAISAKLYDRLIRPLLPDIHHSNVVIVPHGILHYLPFAALWDSKKGGFLIDTHTLTYAPSASSLKYTIAKRNPYEGRSLVVGDPDGSLPHATTEAKAVAAALGSTASLGESATERQIIEQSGDVDILHIASHGNYNEVQPFFSWIDLVGDEEFDGRLETHEIFGLNLKRANLVVLSACRTALGRQTRGDEMVGMTRAFLYAGSPAVMTTLWSVDDAASAALMESFYRHLAEATSSAEALRKAQLEVKSVDHWSSPYYWAAFTLTGDSHWRPGGRDAGRPLVAAKAEGKRNPE